MKGSAMPGPLRIALMLESDGPGGAERMLLQLGVQLRERGHTVCPVGPDTGCGWLAGEFRDLGFEPATFTPGGPLDWRCLPSLLRLFRTRTFDVVHSHEFMMAVYGAATARLKRIPHVITMHGAQYYDQRWRRRRALRWACQRSGGVVAVSTAARTHLTTSLRLPPDAVTVIRNGIAFQSGQRERVRQELGIAADDVLIVTVGNLYAVKGHIVLLRALAELETNGAAVPWRLAMAGRGEEEETLRNFARDLGLSDRVTLLGYRDDVADILAAADIYAMPSLSEGLPVALLEAMFAGKAIVASDVGGIPEVLADGTEGLLTPAGDHHALCGALRLLMHDPDHRADLGQRAAARARAHLSIERVTESYERIYRSAIVDATQRRSVGHTVAHRLQPTVSAETSPQDRSIM
jgi:glycosyltransferase involved in cell wall biosynthesis